MFPHCMHVRDVDLQNALDDVVWRFAADHRPTIVSKDADFHQMSMVFGLPPKVIWIRTGNCSTSGVERLVRTHKSEIDRFLEDREAAFLSLG